MTKPSKGRSRSEGAPKKKPANGNVSGTRGEAAIQVHGWTLFMHPCFLDQVERLAATVEAERTRLPDRWQASASARVLDAIVRLAFDEIPMDPPRKEYRQGGTPGAGRKHWFRAKFGGGRFRLFFRFRTDARILLYVWVNDEQTLRTYGDRDDAYATFARMLDSGNPPDD